jgi:hypothetical protein
VLNIFLPHHFLTDFLPLPFPASTPSFSLSQPPSYQILVLPHCYHFLHQLILHRILFTSSSSLFLRNIFVPPLFFVLLLPPPLVSNCSSYYRTVLVFIFFYLLLLPFSFSKAMNISFTDQLTAVSGDMIPAIYNKGKRRRTQLCTPTRRRRVQSNRVL